MFAPASTIKIASAVPETVKSNKLCSLSVRLGLIINLSSIKPTTTLPVGPEKGMSLIDSAMLLPSIASGSGITSGSTDSAVATIETSLKKPSGNNGLNGLSINLLVKTAWSDGRPSLFLKPPGILPTEYIFSSKSTLSGKKSCPSRGLLFIVALTITTVSPLFRKTLPLD